LLIRPTAFITLLYLLVALCVTAPLATHLTDRVVGDERSNVWGSLWGFWRIEKSILMRYDYSNRPYGGSIFRADYLNTFLRLPLKTLFGPIAGYNLLVLFQLVGGALAMYLLAMRLTVRKAPAFLAGLIYAFSPYMLAVPLSSGASDRLNIAWIPLFFIYCLKITESGKIQNYLIAGGVLLLACLGCREYGQFVYLGVICFSVFYIGRVAGQGVRQKVPMKDLFGGPHFKFLLFKLIPLIVACGLACLAVQAFARYSPDSAYKWTRGNLIRHSMQTIPHGESTFDAMITFHLNDFFLPKDAGLFINRNVDLYYLTVYIGYSLLALALLSVFSKKNYVRFFLPSALFFAILVFGPWIQPFHGSFYYSSPLYSIVRGLLFFNRNIPSWDFMFVVYFQLAIAAALGLDWLLEKSAGRWRTVVAAAFLTAVSAEMYLLSPAPLPVPLTKIHIPAYFNKISQEHKSSAIFDFPPFRSDSVLMPKEYLYYQTIHGKITPYTLGAPNIRAKFVNNRDTTNAAKISELAPAYFYLRSIWYNLARYQIGVDLRLNVNADQVKENIDSFLTPHGFRYFIVHKALIRPDKMVVFRPLFQEAFGEPIEDDADLIVYEVPQPVLQ